jgi:hypothetical protein
VDGEPINYEPELVYNSPYIFSKYNSGLVTIRLGDEELVLEF